MGEIRIGRDDLIARLEARRAMFRKFDTERMAEHKKAEAAALKLFRERLRAASKWTYAELKDHGFRVALSTSSQWSSVLERRVSGEVPTCPESLERKLDHALRPVVASPQARYVISDSGVHGRLYWLLTHDPYEQPEVC